MNHSNLIASRAKQSHGFTMVEMVLVILLMGLVFAGGTVLIRPVLDSWSLTIPREEVTDTSSYAMSRMIYEIAQIRDATSVTAANAGEFRFTDVSDNDIHYWLSGTNVMRNTDILARGIQVLGFSYFNEAHANVAAPQVSPAATDIWRVMITITGQQGDQSVTLESEVHPRNLPRSS